MPRAWRSNPRCPQPPSGRARISRAGLPMTVRHPSSYYQRIPGPPRRNCPCEPSDSCKSRYPPKATVYFRWRQFPRSVSSRRPPRSEARHWKPSIASPEDWLELMQASTYRYPSLSPIKTNSSSSFGFEPYSPRSILIGETSRVHIACEVGEQRIRSHGRPLVIERQSQVAPYVVIERRARHPAVIAPIDAIEPALTVPDPTANRPPLGERVIALQDRVRRQGRSSERNSW